MVEREGGRVGEEKNVFFGLNSFWMVRERGVVVGGGGGGGG